MRTLKLCIAILTMPFIAPLQAQTADEIIDSYFENTGGLE